MNTFHDVLQALSAPVPIDVTRRGWEHIASKTGAQTATSVPEIMTLPEVAAFLRVQPEDLDELSEALPVFEVAGHIRVQRSRLLVWIQEQERRTTRHRAGSDFAETLLIDFGKGVA